MNSGFSPSRRSLIGAASAACAGLLSAHTQATGLSNYARVLGGSKGKGQFFSAEQMQVLAALVEIIIPATDTAGAMATDTHGYIDDQLTHCEAPAKAQVFLASLLRFEKSVLDSKAQPFLRLSDAEQNQVMTALAAGAEPYGESGRAFFKQLKGLTVTGYYTSEQGASVELAYARIPGGYKGDVKLSELGKAWSTGF